MYSGKLLVRYTLASRILAVIYAAMNLKPSAGGCRRNEVNDDLMSDQRLPAPILGNKGKKAMLNFVPFAGSWR